MKNIQITLQPLSLIVGAGLLGIMLITTGAFTPQGTASARDVSATEIVGAFNPRTVVRITEGTTYTVPVGKAFVLTAVSQQGYLGSGEVWVEIKVNGSTELYARVNEPYAVPTGFVFTSGSTIETYTGTSYFGTCHGYLVDA